MSTTGERTAVVFALLSLPLVVLIAVDRLLGMLERAELFDARA
jgi:hypothetical protein